MKKWFKRKIVNFIDNARRTVEHDVYAEPKLAASNSTGDLLSEVRDFNLQIAHATGGIIIRAHKYDRKNDRSHNNLYIIRDDQDLAHELSRIVTMETLR